MFVGQSEPDEEDEVSGDASEDEAINNGSAAGILHEDVDEIILAAVAAEEGRVVPTIEEAGDAEAPAIFEGEASVSARSNKRAHSTPRFDGVANKRYQLMTPEDTQRRDSLPLGLPRNDD